MGRKKSHAQPGGYPPLEPAEALWDTWQEDLLAIYREGGCDVNARAEIIRHRIDAVGAAKAGFCEETWTRWLQDHEDFKEIIHQGRALSEDWWLTKGRQGIEFTQGKNNVRVDPKMYSFGIKNRFRGKYTDNDSKLTIAGDPDAPFVEIKAQLSDQDADTAYYELMERARKSTAPHPGNPMKNRKGRKGEKAREQAREDQARHEGEE